MKTLFIAIGKSKTTPSTLAFIAVQRHIAASKSRRPSKILQHGVVGRIPIVLPIDLPSISEQTPNLRTSFGHVCLLVYFGIGVVGSVGGYGNVGVPGRYGIGVVGNIGGNGNSGGTGRYGIGTTGVCGSTGVPGKYVGVPGKYGGVSGSMGVPGKYGGASGSTGVSGKEGGSTGSVGVTGCNGMPGNVGGHGSVSVLQLMTEEVKKKNNKIIRRTGDIKVLEKAISKWCKQC